MSKEGVVSLIEKALSDEAFKAELKADPQTALSQFDLTEDEIKAITSGGEDQLKALGLDERMSKSFFGGGLGFTVT